MNRRVFLTSLVAATAGLSGCGEQTTETMPEPQQEMPTTTLTQTETPTPADTKSDTPAETESPTETDQPTPEPAVEAAVISSELKINETEYGANAFVTGTIQNTGDVSLFALDVMAKFYNEDGQLLSTGAAQALGVNPDEEWLPRIRYSGDGEEVASAELTVQQTNEIGGRTLIQGNEVYDVLSSELQIPTGEPPFPRLSGKIEKTESTEFQRLRMIGKLYNDNNQLLTTTSDVIMGFEEGEVWDFESVALMRDRDRIEEIARHEVLMVY